jgi:hypothetical protein
MVQGNSPLGDLTNKKMASLDGLESLNDASSSEMSEEIIQMKKRNTFQPDENEIEKIQIDLPQNNKCTSDVDLLNRDI